MKKFYFLSGLPRSGSTMLSAILSQNPEIHAEGNSGLCQIMWDIHQSCTVHSLEQLKANNRFEKLPKEIASQIPHLYYKDSEESIIIDKCRAWTLPMNTDLIKNYITNDYKIIVLERPIVEVVKSFLRVHQENPLTFNMKYIEDLLIQNNDVLMKPLQGIVWAKENNQNNNFLFINYNELTFYPEETIKKIYDFCGWEYFNHDFTNIIPKYPENDFSAYGLKNLHEVRPKIEKRKYEVSLPKEIEDKCLQIDKFMGYLPDTQTPL
jgi:sulfotransferase